MQLRPLLASCLLALSLLGACAPTQQQAANAPEGPAFLKVGQTWVVDATTLTGAKESFSVTLPAPKRQSSGLVTYDGKPQPNGSNVELTSVAYGPKDSETPETMMVAFIRAPLGSSAQPVSHLCAVREPSAYKDFTSFSGAYSTNGPDDVLKNYVQKGVTTGLGTCTVTLKR